MISVVGLERPIARFRKSRLPVVFYESCLPASTPKPARTRLETHYRRCSLLEPTPVAGFFTSACQHQKALTASPSDRHTSALSILSNSAPLPTAERVQCTCVNQRNTAKDCNCSSSHLLFLPLNLDVYLCTYHHVARNNGNASPSHEAGYP